MGRHVVRSAKWRKVADKRFLLCGGYILNGVEAGIIREAVKIIEILICGN